MFGWIARIGQTLVPEGHQIVGSGRQPLTYPGCAVGFRFRDSQRLSELPLRPNLTARLGSPENRESKRRIYLNPKYPAMKSTTTTTPIT